MVQKRWKLLLLLCVTAAMLVLIVVVACYRIIEPYRHYTLQPPYKVHDEVGLVLGAGINNNGKPYKELQARLDVAAEALNAGTVNKLILSGDNRFKNYDEPTAMQNYLIDTKHIAKDKLVRDFAGRSTYESCERAAKIFDLKKVIIFSAASHLPRAAYLCRHFGIETYGIASNLEANNSTRRELLARVKAVYNIHIRGEATVLGAPISLR